MRKTSSYLNFSIRLFSSLPRERIKASFVCPQEYKSQFDKSRALLPISVGMCVHEGEKFRATMELVNKSFGSCSIIVDDTIQRYTMALYHPRKSSQELYMDSLAEGDRWINRNKPILDSLIIPYRIIRWSYWLHHLKFQDAMEQIKQTNKNNPLFQNALEASIREFLSRTSKRIKFDEKLAISACTKYLFEECAAMTLWPDLGCQFEIYPSGRNNILQANYDLLIRPQHPELLRSIGLRFNKKNIEHIIDNPSDDEKKDSSNTISLNQNLYLGFQ